MDYSKIFDPELLRYEFFFNPESRQFGLSNFRTPFDPHDGFVSISSETARRITRKADIVAKMNDFLTSGTLESLMAYGDRGDRELSVPCICHKDGKFYDFYTKDENFIPMQVHAPELCGTTLISKSEFKAIMLYNIFERYFYVPLLDKQPEDYIEFSFYDNGTAIDGTGIIYRGDGSKPETVCIVPSLGDDVCIVPSFCRDERRRKILPKGEKVPVSEFIQDAVERTVYRQKTLYESYSPRNERRDMEMEGLIDIYGEPGGWQFNNED